MDFAEDADCNEEEGEFDAEGHWGVEDGSCVTALDMDVSAGRETHAEVEVDLP